MTKGSGPRIHAVILAGGAGERFWPASRRRHPKPFLRVVGGRTLLDATIARARRFAGRDRVWIVCGKEHARELRAASGLSPGRVLVEPERRNTAMAAAWVALRIVADDPDAVIAVLPADHHIPDAAAFASDIRRAARAAADGDRLVTLGVEPTRPDTGYGYIQAGPAVGEAHPGVCQVRRFVEKPDLARARRYLAEGGYLWNAGVFVWGARRFLEEVRTCAPDLHRALGPLRRAPKGRNREAVARAYHRAPSLPVDVAIMERSERVWTLPVHFAWSDVGTWFSLAEELGVGTPVSPEGAPSDPEAAGAGSQGGGRKPRGPRGDDAGNRIIEGDVLLEDASANLVWGGKRVVALLGVRDLAVIDTDDVILVTKLDRSPDVKRFVARLKAAGRDRLT